MTTKLKNVRPYGNWEQISDDVYYNKDKDLYWCEKTNQIYDELSASHNGLIGYGRQLRDILKKEN